MPETISHEAESTSHCELNIFQRREIREYRTHTLTHSHTHPPPGPNNNHNNKIKTAGHLALD